ncbi:hypothetical protein [Xanthomonas sp. 3498]|uniref:hypothetical protein n=1 Tax=Xanthomonas sp. 3498 TaxID=2663863 RepID=UPI00161A2DBD|nr:hypothetical protein [Xanthomonas sp. 3498]MBB5876295.1 hypothetical protein [Xanthomonas sp. 3498]
MRAMRDAAAAMDNAADLINVAIEQLMRDRIKLPAFRVRSCVTSRMKRFGDYIIDANAIPKSYEIELALVA